MLVSTYKLVNKLRKENNHELAERVLELAWAFDRWENTVNNFAKQTIDVGDEEHSVIREVPEHDCHAGLDDGCHVCSECMPDLTDYYYEQWKDAQIEMAESEGQ